MVVNLFLEKVKGNREKNTVCGFKIYKNGYYKWA